MSKTATKRAPRATAKRKTHPDLHEVEAQLEQGEHVVAKLALAGDVYALILPPLAKRFHEPAPWNESAKNVAGALSYNDGLANTLAMQKAGSALAAWALDNKLYLPSMDELELCYRYLKPGTAKNWCYARSGINVSAVPPTYPYTPDFPTQTDRKPFRAGGPEAFAEDYYWTSTQRPANADYAFVQYFDGGNQNYYHESGRCRACAVRRIQLSAP